METSSLKVIFVVITIIFGTSIIGVGEMSDNQDDKEEGWIKKIMKNDNWYKKILDFFDFKKLKGFMNSQNTNSEDFNSENFGSEEFNSIKWICGNGKIDTDPQSDEECEPPNTATCDENCHFRPPPPPPELEHAFIDLGLDKVFVDPNGQPNTGDEYFDNLITECSFHSDESIHGNVCLACLLVDKKIEPCEDLTLSLTEFAHGTILGNTQGFPNAAIDGVTVSAVANVGPEGGKNAVIIFDGDVNGDLDENPTPDPDLRKSGVCPNCAGLHIAIIAENTNGGADGIVDKPDDNALGGIQTWVFDKEWYVSSFDFVDYDNPNENGQARAYDNPQCSGTPVATADIKKSPNGGDGSVQTILLNANHVRCLKFEYKDSGGVTNIKLECIKKFNDDGLLSKGKLVLPDGYEASTKLSIPLEHGVDVQKAVGVKIDTRCPGGCSLGFWKNHPEAWVTYQTTQKYAATFGLVAPQADLTITVSGNPIKLKDVTLLQALQAQGGGLNNLARQSVAALLNSVALSETFPYTTAQVISLTQAAIIGGTTTIESQAQAFDTANNLGSPLCDDDKSPKVIFSTGFEDTTEKSNWIFDSSRSGVASNGPQKREILTSDSSDPANAHTGTKYLGGSGDFDPDFAAYNRSIDVSAYHSVQISLWYSSEDTETVDDYALYYKDGSNWIPIKEVPSSELNSSSGQTSWKNVIKAIPDSVDTLVIQFRWSTSSTSEHMMLDDIEITGIQN